MGSDKALVLVNGEPLALRTAGILQKAGCATVHLVGRQAELASFGLPVIKESTDLYHPLFGVAAALAHCSDPCMMIVPCDITNLCTEHVRTLHPLFGIFSTDMAQQAHELAARSAPAHLLAQHLPSIPVPLPQLQDANRPGDIPG
jgi:molybdopterin-guanine dinucleotide biosynthesis protein A